MYVIQRGIVQIFKRVGGEERPLATLGRGEFVGEMAILNGKPRTATRHRPRGRASAWSSTGKTLETMISNNTEIALRLVKKLAQRLDSADEMIQILLNPDPKARVLLGLKRHAETLSARRRPTRACKRRTSSPDDLAREVGVDEAHVRDVLARLRRLRIATEDEPGARRDRHRGRRPAARVPRVPRDAAKVRGLGARRGAPRHRLPRRRDAAAPDERVRRRRPHRDRRRLADERHGARRRSARSRPCWSATRTSTTSATSRPSPTTAPSTAAEPLVVAGTTPTLAILKKHFFNGLLWPDFSKIPNARRADHPLPRAQARESRRRSRATGPRHPGEPHHRDAARSSCEAEGRRRSRTAATPGPTDRLWEVLERDDRTCRRCSWR